MTKWRKTGTLFRPAPGSAAPGRLPLLLLALFLATPVRPAPGATSLTEPAGPQNSRPELSGVWQFYPGKWIPKDGSISAAPQLVSVPGPFPEQKDGSGPHRYGSYRKVIKLPAPWRVRTLGLKIINVNSSYRLFVNGREIGSGGTPAATRRKSSAIFRPVIHEFYPDSDVLDIRLYVSNFFHRHGGLLRSPLLAPPEILRRLTYRQLVLEFFLAGAIFLTGLYHLALFFLRRREKSPLYFGLFCLLIFVRIPVTGEKFLAYLMDGLNWELAFKLEYLSYYPGPPVFLAFLNALFPGRLPARLYRALVWMALPFLLLVAFTPVRVYSHSLPFFQGYTILTGLVIVWALLGAWRAKHAGARTMFLGFIPLLAAVLHDILYTGGWSGWGFITPLGLFLFIFFQAYLLSVRFTRSLDDSETLAGELVRLDRMKDEFLARTSHELRTPLHGMVGLADSLLDGGAGPPPAKLSPAVRKNLELMVQSGRRLTRLVNDILDFTRLRAGRARMEIATVDLAAILELSAGLLEPLLRKKNLEFQIDIDPDFPPLLADPTRLQQIIDNLLGNAVKFTPPGGKILVTASRDGDKYALVRIADSAAPIPDKEREAIFREFYQADNGRTSAPGGTGLGLSIACELAELQHGALWLDATGSQQTGNTFCLRLPRAGTGAKGGAQTRSATPVFETNHRPLIPLELQSPPLVEAEGPPIKDSGFQADEDNGRGLTVLVVDDEAVNRQVVKNLLEPRGCVVLEAANGLEALEVTGDKSPDLILLDIMMPGLNGVEVLRRLRELRSLAELPIILLTARAGPEETRTGLEAGANDYITKPFRREEFLARVKTQFSLVRSRQAFRQLTELQKELTIAREIQNSVLPDAFPTSDSWKVSHRLIPVNSVGGDFYDFLEAGDKRMGVLLADVSGHGIPAALIVSMVKVAFHHQRPVMDDPGRLLERLNESLRGNCGDHFVTACYAYLDRAAGILSLGGAGHPPVLFIDYASERLTRHRPVGQALGRQPGVWEGENLLLQPGRKYRLVLYSDGVTDALNSRGEPFGEKRLEELVWKFRAQESRKTRDRLLNEVSTWRGEPPSDNGSEFTRFSATNFVATDSGRDDLTLIVIDF